MPDRRPSPDEYADYYAGYIGRVPVGPIVETLTIQRETHYLSLKEIPESMADYRYAPGKWTVTELLGHVVDSERVFGFRALHFARGAAGSIPGMDQDEFAQAAPYRNRSLTSIIDELYMLRGANLEQFRAFDEAIMNRDGIASDCRFTVRALLYIMAGHERHHMGVLRARYLD
ncbi:MAG: DinB family protein [Rhodothermales bacterium]|nr:DinB family protein [Rhodothermales bacterium]MBO6779230.1 DinB family protein [Rhodothermales bacterium]